MAFVNLKEPYITVKDIHIFPYSLSNKRALAVKQPLRKPD